MTTKVEKSVVVDVPLSTVYDQWTQFEEFPRFMTGVEQVTQLGDDRLEWVAEIAGVRRQWIAKILEQVPDRKVAWAAVEGATNAGEVTFEAIGPEQTEVHLVLEYEPEGLAENVGDRLGIVAGQAEGDLERFKGFIESEGRETGAWRDSGKVGDRGGEPSESVGGGFAEGGLPGTIRADLARDRGGEPSESVGGGSAKGGLPGTIRADLARDHGWEPPESASLVRESRHQGEEPPAPRE